MPKLIFHSDFLSGAYELPFLYLRMSHRLSEAEVIRLQHIKAPYDSAHDPREYSPAEVLALSHHMMAVWSGGSTRTNRVSGTRFSGK